MAKDKAVELEKELEKAAEPAPAAKEPEMTFDVWFSSLGKPQHHKSGMKAYARTEVRRTKAGWESLFKSY